MTGVGEASLRALAKLEQVLPSRLRERAAAISQATVPLSGPVAAVDPETLITIARACRNCERLEFSYRGRDGERQRAGWSHTGSSRPVTAGTWSHGTRTRRTGERSGQTGSRRRP